MTVGERLLLARLRAREEEAFNEVVGLYADKVFNLVFRLVGSAAEAEDIAQEVFVTLWKSVDTFRGEAKFSTWLLRIAANHAKNRIKYLSRRAKPGALAAIDDAPDGDPDQAQGELPQGHMVPPDLAFENAERDGLIQQAIAALEEDHRLLLILRDIEELPYDEIAEITGLPEGTVKSRLHRARHALRIIIETGPGGTLGKGQIP